MDLKNIKYTKEAGGLIAGSILTWVFLSNQFVTAAEYNQDRLAYHATMVAIQVELVEIRIDDAEDDSEPDRVKELERRRGRLERQQEIIMEKQL